MDRPLSVGVQRRPHRRSCILGQPHRCVASRPRMDMPPHSIEQERGRTKDLGRKLGIRTARGRGSSDAEPRTRLLDALSDAREFGAAGPKRPSRSIFYNTLQCPRQALTAPSSRGRLPDQRQMSPGGGRRGSPDTQHALKPVAWAAGRVTALILSDGPVVCKLMRQESRTTLVHPSGIDGLIILARGPRYSARGFPA